MGKGKVTLYFDVCCYVGCNLDGGGDKSTCVLFFYGRCYKHVKFLYITTRNVTLLFSLFMERSNGRTSRNVLRSKQVQFICCLIDWWTLQWFQYTCVSCSYCNLFSYTCASCSYGNLFKLCLVAVDWYHNFAPPNFILCVFVLAGGGPGGSA